MTSKRRADKAVASLPPEPARAIGMGTRAPTRLERLVGRIKALRVVIVGIAGVGAILSGLSGYWSAYQAAREGIQASLLSIVGKGDAGPLSLVVLPFANLTGDPQQAHVADGLTAAVTADLSRIRDAFIVSTASAFAYKDKPVTVQQVGKELGVRFALQGGVQRNGDKIRIHAQLADTASNAQLWSENFDGDQADLFALQELVTARIGNSIGREMVIVAARDSETRKSDPKVADLLMRATAIGLKPESKAIYADAQALYRQVLNLEPNNVKAIAGLAVSLSTEAFNGWVTDPVGREKQLVDARDLALRAKELDPNDPRTYVTLADFAVEHGDHEAGIRLAETALSLDPKNPRQYNNVAVAYANAGQAKRAIELLSQGMRLDPKNVDERFLANMGFLNFMAGDDEAALQWMLKAADANPAVKAAHAGLAMLYARKGQQARAQAAAAALLRLDPKITLSAFEGRSVESFAPAYREYWDTKLLPAWRLAGLPE